MLRTSARVSSVMDVSMTECPASERETLCTLGAPGRIARCSGPCRKRSHATALESMSRLEHARTCSALRLALRPKDLTRKAHRRCCKLTMKTTLLVAAAAAPRTGGSSLSLAPDAAHPSPTPLPTGWAHLADHYWKGAAGAAVETPRCHVSPVSSHRRG